jgi:serine/threonine-protein kinase
VITDHLLAGRYQIGDVVGQGDMSVVLRGRDLRLDREVAIKVLRGDLVGDDLAGTRFRREARNASSLNHPAIVGVYDTGETEGDPGSAGDGSGTPFIVMEYVDGQTLRELIAREGPISPRRAAEIAADVCAALDFSHRHGIVHRDVAPRNILLTRVGAVKVMDFGVARPMVDRTGAQVSSATPGGAQYLSPEQARGEPVDARSDVYGMGCVLFEMLTSKPPFTAESAVAVAQRHVRDTPLQPSAVNPAVGAELDEIVLTALHKDPLDRYQTAAAMRTALTRALTHLARPMTAAELELPADRRPTTSSAGSPPLLAPPGQVIAGDDFGPDDRSRSKRIWGFVGIAVICALLLAGAGWLTVQVLTTAPPPAPVLVPELTGKSVDEVAAILKEKNLSLGAVVEVESAADASGKVVSQRPSGQTQVDRDTAVNIEIGRGVTMVNVPELIGLTEGAAQQALTAANLAFAEAQQPSSDADRGHVVAQSADAQSPIAPGSVVTITIGTGMTLIDVPDGLVGKSVDEATETLRAAGFDVLPVEADGTQPANQVIGIDQPAGKALPEGTPITLRYSNNALMLMPAITGQNPDRAARTLQNLGWGGSVDTLSVTQAPTSSQVGSIVTQDPAPGQVVNKFGTPIRVGVGVKQITMPNVIGKTQEQAAAQLSRAGATAVTFTDAGAGPRGQAGKVKSQSAPPNSAITSETPVLIAVYSS